VSKLHVNELRNTQAHLLKVYLRRVGQDISCLRKSRL